MQDVRRPAQLGLPVKVCIYSVLDTFGMLGIFDAFDMFGRSCFLFFVSPDGNVLLARYKNSPFPLFF